MKVKTILNNLVDTYKNISKPAKASLWFVVCNIINKGIAFITTPVFTRFLTQEEFGVVNVYFSWVSIITIFATLELATGVFNKAMIKYENDKDGYTSVSLTVASVTTVALFLLYFVSRKYCNPILGIETPLVVLLFIQIFFSTPVSLWSIRKRFEYEYKGIVIVTVLSNLLGTVLNLFLIFSFPEYHIYDRILGTIIVNVIINIILIIDIYKKGKKIFDVSYCKYALNYNMPLIPHYLSQQVLEQSDRIMIDKFCGSVDVALFSLSYQVASIMKIVINAIHASFMPWTFQSLKEKNYKAIGQRTFQIEILIGVMCILASLFAPEMVLILGGESYMSAIYIVPAVSMSVLFLSIYSFFGNIEFYFEKTKFSMIASMIVAVLNIVLNYIFIKKYGFVAAGYTTLASYIFYAAIHYVFMKFVCRQNNIPNPYNGFLMWGVAIALTVVAILMSFTYKYYLLRYVIILVLVVFIANFIKKKKNLIFAKK